MCPPACGRESRKGLASALRAQGTGQTLDGRLGQHGGLSAGQNPWPGVAARSHPVHSARREGEREHRGFEGGEVTLCDTVTVDTYH